MSTQSLYNSNVENELNDVGTVVSCNEIWEHNSKDVRVKVKSVNQNDVESLIVYSDGYKERPGDLITLSKDAFRNGNWNFCV